MSNPEFCTIHSQPMRWMESKTKFNEDGTAKTYLAHRTAEGKMCFGKGTSDNYSSPKNFEKSIDSTDKPDWDAIAEGKVRHGVAVAFIGALKVDSIEKMDCTEGIKMIMDQWVDWIMRG